MATTSHRVEQVAELIKQELSMLLLRETEFPPGTLVTISRVSVTRDMRHAKVFLSIMPYARRFVVMEKLKHHRYDLQGEINEKLQMKIVPRINFVFDKTEEDASVVDKLLDNIAKEK